MEHSLSKRIIFSVLLAMVFLIPCAIWNGTANAGLIKYLVARSGIIIIAGLLLFDAFRSGRAVLPEKKFVVSGCLFLLYAAFTCVFNRYTDWVLFGDMCLSVLLFFETYLFLERKRDLTLLLTVWQFASILVQAYYLLQLAGKDFYVWTSPDLVGSLYVNRNALVYYLLCTYPFSIMMLLKPGKLCRILPAVSLVLMVIILIISPARVLKMVVVITAPMMLWYVARRLPTLRSIKTVQKLVRLLPALSGIGTAGVILWVIAKGYDYGNLITHNRLLIWKETIPVMMERLWVGYGSGTFQPVFSKFRSVMIGYAFPFEDPLFNTHNEILELTFEYGMVGIALFAVFLLMVTIRTLRLVKRDTEHNDLLFFSGFALLCCFLCAQLIDVSHFIFCSFFSWMVLGIFARQLKAPETFQIGSTRVKGCLLLVMVLFGMASGVLISRYAHHFMSEVYLMRTIHAVKAKDSPDNVLRLIEVALKHDPHNPAVLFQRAYIATTTGNLDAALEDYRHIEKLQPYFTNLHFNMGVIYYQKKEYQNALQMLLVTVHLYPLFTEGVLYLAKTHEALGNFDQALVLCRHLLVLDKGNRGYMMFHNELVAKKKGRLINKP